MKLIITLEVDVPEGATLEQTEEAVRAVHGNPLEIEGVGMIYDWSSMSVQVAE